MMLAIWALVVAILILSAAIIAVAIALTRYSHEELSEEEIARRTAPLTAELFVSRAERRIRDEEGD
jgi:signal transduction histidine kinase